jgi:hypothetical protein
LTRSLSLVALSESMQITRTSQFGWPRPATKSPRCFAGAAVPRRS